MWFVRRNGYLLSAFQIFFLMYDRWWSNVVQAVGFIICRITPEKQFYNTSGGKFITLFGPWEPIYAGPLLMIVRFYSSSLYLFFIGTMSDDLAFLSPIFHLYQPSPIIFYPLVSKVLKKQGFGNMINVNGWWNLLDLVSWLSTNGWCWWWGKCIW